MKTAVLLVGNIRTWELCKQNFIDTFGDIDVFVSTYDLKYGYHPAIQNKFQDFGDEIMSPNNVVEYFKGINVKSLTIESSQKSDEIINSEIPNLHESMRNFASSYAQYRKFKHCIDSMIEYEDKYGVKYDRVVRTRCDMLHGSQILDPVRGNEILHNPPSIPGTEFIPDQVIVTNRDNMIEICNFIIKEFYNPVFDDSHLHPPHGILRNAIKYLGLNKIEKDLFKGMLRKNGIVE